MVLVDCVVLSQRSGDSMARDLEQMEGQLRDSLDDAARQDDRRLDDREENRTGEARTKSPHGCGEPREFGVLEQGRRIAGDEVALEAIPKVVSGGRSGGDDPLRHPANTTCLPAARRGRRSPLRGSSQQQSAGVPAWSELDEWDVAFGSRCDAEGRWRRVFGG